MRQLWHRQCARGYPPLWITTGFSLALTQPLFAEQEGLTSLTQAPRRFLVQLRAGSVPRLSRWQKRHTWTCADKSGRLSASTEKTLYLSFLLPSSLPQQQEDNKGGQKPKRAEAPDQETRQRCETAAKEGVRAHDPTPAYVKTWPLPALLPPEVLGGRWLLLDEGDKDIRLELFQRKLKLAFMSMKYKRRWGLADNNKERYGLLW